MKHFSDAKALSSYLKTWQVFVQTRLIFAGQALQSFCYNMIISK